MIEYATTATFHFATSVKPEMGLEKETRLVIKQYIEQEGLDAFLDTLEYGDTTETELTQEEIDALSESDNIVFPIEGLKETLLAISLGLLEVDEMTKEEAAERLKKLSEDYDTPTD
jgi:hypothetical protein